MSTSPIPANIDVQAIISDLNLWGWRDYKIEVVCGFSGGYIAQLKCNHIKQVSYQYGARLYNFWLDEQGHVSRATLSTQTLDATTS